VREANRPNPLIEQKARDERAHIFEVVQRGPPVLGLFVLSVFAGNVIFRDFVGVNFFFLVRSGVFDARHDISLKSVSFLHQFFHALGIRALTSGQALRISRLARPSRSQSPDLELSFRGFTQL
jgi:hypothetical protein